jgi:hypothetical protein
VTRGVRNSHEFAIKNAIFFYLCDMIGLSVYCKMLKERRTNCEYLHTPNSNLNKSTVFRRYLKTSECVCVCCEPVLLTPLLLTTRQCICILLHMFIYVF